MIELTTIRLARPKVPESWIRLMQFAQERPFSTIKLTFREGEPHTAEEAVESIKF